MLLPLCLGLLRQLIRAATLNCVTRVSFVHFQFSATFRLTLGKSRQQQRLLLYSNTSYVNGKPNESAMNLSSHVNWVATTLGLTLTALRSDLSCLAISIQWESLKLVEVYYCRRIAKSRVSVVRQVPFDCVRSHCKPHLWM